MNVLTAVFYPFLLGILSLQVVLRGIPLKNRALFYCSTAFPIGAGLCSLILFFAYLLNPPQAKFISLAVSFITLTVLVGYWISKIAQESPVSFNPFTFLSRLRRIDLKDKHLLPGILLSSASFLLFVVTLLAVIQFYSLTAPANVFGGWDTRFFWTLKAKFFFRSPADWQGMFSPKLFWSHPDYPLLLPGILAWGWHWLGQESLLWGPIVSLGFYLSCVFLVVWYLRTYVSSFAGWLAGSFLLVLEPYLFWSLQQYADVPLSFFMTACVLVLVTALRSEQNRLFFLSGLMGGLAAWTKNEGLFFLVEVTFLLGIYCAISCRANRRNAWKPSAWFAWGTLLPLLAIILLKTFLGTTGDYILGSKRTLHDYTHLIFAGWDRTSLIFQAYFIYMKSFATWKGTWILFAVASFILGFRKKLEIDGYAWGIFLAVLLINLGYLLALHITPYDIKFQIQTALDRLLLHSGLLAIVFAFEVLSSSLSKKQRADDPLKGHLPFST